MGELLRVAHNFEGDLWSRRAAPLTVVELSVRLPHSFSTFLLPVLVPVRSPVFERQCIQIPILHISSLS